MSHICRSRWKATLEPICSAVDCAAVGGDGELGQFVIEAAQVVADQVDEQPRGIGVDPDAVGFRRAGSAHCGRSFALGGLHSSICPTLAISLVNPLVGRKRIQPQHQRRAVAGAGGIVFELLAEAGDERVGVAHDDGLARRRTSRSCAAHPARRPVRRARRPRRSAARRAAVNCRISSQFLNLQERVGADQRVNRFGHGRLL